MKNEKMKYEAPELEIVVFDIQDIITTSGFQGEDHNFGYAGYDSNS